MAQSCCSTPRCTHTHFPTCCSQQTASCHGMKCMWQPLPNCRCSRHTRRTQILRWTLCRRWRSPLHTGCRHRLHEHSCSILHARKASFYKALRISSRVVFETVSMLLCRSNRSKTNTKSRVSWSQAVTRQAGCAVAGGCGAVISRGASARRFRHAPRIRLSVVVA